MGVNKKEMMALIDKKYNKIINGNLYNSFLIEKHFYKNLNDVKNNAVPLSQQ